MTQTGEIKRTWRIGELAEATGITLRALRHYDRLGLLPPADRTDAGYRVYGESEMQRLYMIVALRELGLSLSEIGTSLDAMAGMDRATLIDVVERHRASVRSRLDEMQAMETHLVGLLNALRSSDRPAITELRTILEAIAMHNKYYTPEQLAELEARRTELGPEGMEKAQADWQELIAEVAAEKDKGTDPSDPRMQELAGRWQGLIDAFTGGDPGMFASLKKLYESEGPEAASRGMVDPGLMAYMGTALQKRSEGGA